MCVFVREGGREGERVREREKKKRKRERERERFTHLKGRNSERWPNFSCWKFLRHNSGRALSVSG